jgi:hypothetical protein
MTPEAPSEANYSPASGTEKSWGLRSASNKFRNTRFAAAFVSSLAKCYTLGTHKINIAKHVKFDLEGTEYTEYTEYTSTPQSYHEGVALSDLVEEIL